MRKATVEEGKFLTCPQQIYNYEMACQKRKTSRERQARLRAKRNESSEQKKVSDIEEDLQDNSSSKNIEEDNPFGIEQDPKELFR